MNGKLDWSDYELVLRIAEAGSLSEAARRCGSSHPTLFRRINAVEEKLGVRLLNRFRTGYLPTAEGEEIVSTARRIAEMTTETERRVAGRDLRPTGVVRLATTDTLLFGLLGPEIRDFRRSHPGITLDVLVSNAVSDLSLREADVAIRPAASPDDRLVGRRLGVIRQAAYAHRSLDPDGEAGPPPDVLPWIGPSSSMPYDRLQAWFRQTGHEEACIGRISSVLGFYSAVRCGIGVAVLPCYLGDGDPDLVRVGDRIDDVAVDLWLLAHPDLRGVARVRAVLDHFGRPGVFPDL